MNEQRSPVSHGGRPPQRIGTPPAVAGQLALPSSPHGGVTSDLNVSELWTILLKWRWLIAGTTLVGLIAAIAITVLMPRVYEATATIAIATQPQQIVNLGNVQQADNQSADFMATQMGILQTRTLAARVARDLNLASDPSLVDQSASRAERERRATSAVAHNFTAEPVRYSRLIKLIFDSRDPKTAARVANGYAQSFIASNLERQYEMSAYARDFLSRQIAITKTKLENTERQLYDYARANGIVLVGGNEGSDTTGASGSSLVSTSLAAANAALAQAQTERITAEQNYRQAQAAGSTTQMLTNPVVERLQQQRAELQTQFEENAQTFKPDYPVQVRLKTRIDMITKQLAAQTTEFTSALRGDYRAALARQQVLAGKVRDLQRSTLDLRGRSINYNILQREVDTNRTLYDGLLQRFKEVSVSGGTGQNLISIVDDAQVPGRPVSPILMLNLAIGLAAGLVLGIGAALAIEFVDDTIATPDDIDHKLGLTLLGVIPHAGKDTSFVEQLANSKSAVTEAYLSVRTVLQFATERGLPSTLLVTSSREGEGKSSTSLALAQNFARDGKRVLLLDADMRKPTFRMQGGDQLGLSSLLTGEDEIERAVHLTSTEGLYVMPSGPIPPNPAELISGDRMKNLLLELSRIFDSVVIDAPPVLGLADAPLLSSLVESTVVVFEARRIRRQIARNSVARLRTANGRIAGAVLTKYRERFGTSHFGYGYDDTAYTYGSTDRAKMIDLAVKS